MGKKILIADDSSAMLKIGVMCLNKLGAEVVTASNGIEAVEIAKSEKPDIILLDAEMPEMDGWEACREIKKLFPNIPVLLCTGHDLSGEEDQMKDAGVADYITKPINPDIIKTKIAPYIS